MWHMKRDYQRQEIGCFQYTERGRPSDVSEQSWISRANFVFDVTHTIESVEGDDISGWVIQMYGRNLKPRQCIITCEEASSTSKLRRKLMKGSPGAIARFTSEDFMDMLEQDIRRAPLDTIYVVTKCGKFVIKQTHYWVFPNCVVKDGIVECLQKDPMSEDSTKSSTKSTNKSNNSNNSNNSMLLYESTSTVLPTETDALPLSKTMCHGSKSFKFLGHATRQFYGPRSIHCLHVYATGLKAILKDEIMKNEHMFSVTNLSGPPNIGKTLACTTVLRMLNSPKLMLSNATASSLLETCHSNKNLLIVWDDPREVNKSTLATIVHEAFQGHISSTISRGNRSYNSMVLIGTQSNNLGMEASCDTAPTLSRLSHIDMNFATNFKPKANAQKDIVALFPELPHMFLRLIQCTYDRSLTDKLYTLLKKKASQDTLDRALRIAAIDWNLCLKFNELGLQFDPNEIRDYFMHTYLGTIEKSCSTTNVITKLFREIHGHEEHLSHCYKPKVVVELKKSGLSECVAVHLKGLFEKRGKDIKSFTMEEVQGYIKKNDHIGELNHNVNFRNKDAAKIARGADARDVKTPVKRALVIRVSFLKELMIL